MRFRLVSWSRNAQSIARLMRGPKRRLVRRVRRGVLAGTQADYLKHKEAARTFVQQRLMQLNRMYGFRYKRIAIKNTSTRWGSCSRQGNLNFHYKIILLPSDLADYVLVHELCHLHELNHSPRFWALVAKTVPDHTLLRRRLHEWHKQS